jgi:O-antigen/teichoic acid export membrane protein
LEFGRHIGKGVWALADKALPALYGIGLIFLAIRILPEREYGAFVVIQTVFNIIVTFGYALALQPLIKFAAERENHGSYVVAGIVMNAGLFLIVSLVVFIARADIASLFDPTRQGELADLLSYLPILFFSAFYRGFSVSLLQATYQIQRIFWIDSVYFLGALALMFAARLVGMFSTAKELILILIIAQSCSSILAWCLSRQVLRIKLAVDRRSFSEMWNYGKYNFGGNALYTVYSQMDIFFVSSIIGLSAVAVYNAGKMFTRLYDILSQAAALFLIPYSSKWYARKDIHALTTVAEKSICFASLIMIPVFVAYFVFPDGLLALMYHGKYNDAASTLRIFSFVALVVPWNALLGSYVIGTGKVRGGFFASIFHVTVAIACFSIGIRAFGIEGAATSYLATTLVLSVTLWIYLKRTIPFTVKGILNHLPDVWIFVRSRILSGSSR